MDIGSRIRALRRARKLTLQAMEEKTGINNGNLSKIETGKQGLTHDTMVRISQALGVTVASLFEESSNETLSNTPVIIRPLEAGGEVISSLAGYASVADLPRGGTVVISGIQVVSDPGRPPSWRPDPAAANEVRTDEIRHLTSPLSALVTTVVRNHDMAPRLFPGDTLVIDTSESGVTKDGGVYAFIYCADVVIRRAFRRPAGGILLHSDNADIPTITLDARELESVCIVGRVKHRSGPGDF